MRILLGGLLMAIVFGVAIPAQAQDMTQLYGTPVIDQNTGMLRLENREVRLWGISAMVPGQSCWLQESPWGCGDEATDVLASIIENHGVRCTVLNVNSDGSVAGQCFRQENGVEEDLARVLVYNGWALDVPEVSNGLYAADEDNARQARRGIWTSRFQRPEDWSQNIQRFVGYQMAPVPVETVTTTNVLPYYYPQNTIIYLPQQRIYDRRHYDHYDNWSHRDARNRDRHPDRRPEAPASVPVAPNGGGNAYDNLSDRIQRQHLDPHLRVNGGGNAYDNLTDRIQQQNSDRANAETRAHSHRPQGNSRPDNVKPQPQNAPAPAASQPAPQRPASAPNGPRYYDSKGMETEAPGKMR